MLMHTPILPYCTVPVQHNETGLVPNRHFCSRVDQYAVLCVPVRTVLCMVSFLSSFIHSPTGTRAADSKKFQMPCRTGSDFKPITSGSSRLYYSTVQGNNSFVFEVIPFFRIIMIKLLLSTLLAVQYALFSNAFVAQAPVTTRTCQLRSTLLPFKTFGGNDQHEVRVEHTMVPSKPQIVSLNSPEELKQFLEEGDERLCTIK